MPENTPIRIGTRASQLARWQAEWVGEQLRRAEFHVELVPISTKGDQQTGQPIARIGSIGIFTKEIQQALLDERIDVAVHSLKDLPTEAVGGLVLAAVPRRAPPGDVLVSREGVRLESLPERSQIGTGSLRRRAQLLHARPDLVMVDIRGNVDTRLAKLAAGECDAIVLAEAGLIRLGLEDRITERLPTSLMLPAVGQGALGIEIRANDDRVHKAVATIDDHSTHQEVLAERAMLAELRGGCLAPVGAWGFVEGDGRLHLHARVLSRDGTHKIDEWAESDLRKSIELGRQVARKLLDRGAGELIEAARDG